MKKARALLKEEAGAAVIEYSLIIAMISIALVMNLPPLQDGFCSFTTKVVQMLGSASSCGGDGG
jgi:Flp pilus assembly pilin Flp